MKREDFLAIIAICFILIIGMITYIDYKRDQENNKTTVRKCSVIEVGCTTKR